MANEKFYFVFSEEPNTKYFIDEPINFSEVDFVLEQKENRLGRDESLNGGENRFRFTDYGNHYLEKLLYYYHKYYSEADIVLGIITELKQVYESELHFVDIDTDELTYLECRTIVKGSQQTIKSRRETKVDLFSNTDIEGNYIEPLQPQNMLLKAKPSLQISRWEKPDNADYYISSSFLLKTFNPAQSLVKSEIDDSFTFFQKEIFVNGVSGGIEPFKILLAQSNLKNVNILIKNAKGVTFGNSILRLYICINTTPHKIMDLTGEGSNQTDYLYKILQLQRGDTVSLFWLVQNKAIVNLDYFEVTADSTSYNSIVPTFRLIDVMRQVVKSISGQSVLSQRYDFAGQFYDNVFFNGNLMRAVPEKPFYVSLEDIEDFIWGEHKGDSEIQEDGTVFFGIEKDFYTDVECGFFDSTQFEEMSKNTNQKYALNEFKFKYGKYQSLKENTEPNSDSTIHGESIWTFFNRRSPNKLEISINPVRDSILIDAQQRLATKVSKDTATQEDDTIFVLDVIETTDDYVFTETTNLMHTYTNPNLTLRSNGEVNFITLGIKPFTTFIIETPNVNAGTFLVESVATTEIVLSGGNWNSVNDGEKLTKYTYEIKKETVPLTNRTNEGFTAIDNLISPDKYSNMRYSVKRNILNYWNNTLATANLAWKEKVLKNTYYKNNGKCNTTYADLTVIENADFIPTDPILSPCIYQGLTFVNVAFDDYVTLRNNIKKDRGFIRAINKNNRVIRVYPEKVSYINAEKRLVIEGEERFEKAYLTISNEGGVILVNNETRLIRLDYTFHKESQEISLFDKERQRLYNPVFWDKVSVNGANAETIEQLISWLDLLT